jgi:hypothetical protein
MFAHRLERLSEARGARPGSAGLQPLTGARSTPGAL